jgi:hypothetical protein
MVHTQAWRSDRLDKVQTVMGESVQTYNFVVDVNIDLQNRLNLFLPLEDTHIDAYEVIPQVAKVNTE